MIQTLMPPCPVCGTILREDETCPQCSVRVFASGRVEIDARDTAHPGRLVASFEALAVDVKDGIDLGIAWMRLQEARRPGGCGIVHVVSHKSSLETMQRFASALGFVVVVSSVATGEDGQPWVMLEIRLPQSDRRGT